MPPVYGAAPAPPAPSHAFHAYGGHHVHASVQQPGASNAQGAHAQHTPPQALVARARLPGPLAAVALNTPAQPGAPLLAAVCGRDVLRIYSCAIGAEASQSQMSDSLSAGASTRLSSAAPQGPSLSALGSVFVSNQAPPALSAVPVRAHVTPSGTAGAYGVATASHSPSLAHLACSFAEVANLRLVPLGVPSTAAPSSLSAVQPSSAHQSPSPSAAYAFPRSHAAAAATVAGTRRREFLGTGSHSTSTTAASSATSAFSSTSTSSTPSSAVASAIARASLSFVSNDVKWGNTLLSHLLASASANGSILIYDVSKTTLLNSTTSLASSQQGTHPLNYPHPPGNQHTATRLERVLTPHARSINRLAFHPIDPLLISASQDGTLACHDLRVPFALSGRPAWVIEAKSEAARDITIHPLSGLEICAGFDGGIVTRWDTRYLALPIAKWTAHSGLVLSVAYHPTHPRYIASAGRDKIVKVWDTGRLVSQPQPLLSQAATASTTGMAGASSNYYTNTSTSFSNSKQFQTPHQAFAAYTPSAVVRVVWRPSSTSESSSLAHLSSSLFPSSAFPGISSHSETQLATAALSGDPAIHIWDLARPYVPFASLHVHDSAVTGLEFASPDLVVSVSKARILVAADIRIAASRRLDLLSTAAAAFSPHGQLTFAIEEWGGAYINATSTTAPSSNSATVAGSTAVATANASEKERAQLGDRDGKLFIGSNTANLLAADDTNGNYSEHTSQVLGAHSSAQTVEHQSGSTGTTGKAGTPTKRRPGAALSVASTSSAHSHSALASAAAATAASYPELVVTSFTPQQTIGMLRGLASSGGSTNTRKFLANMVVPPTSHLRKVILARSRLFARTAAEADNIAFSYSDFRSGGFSPPTSVGTTMTGATATVKHSSLANSPSERKCLIEETFDSIRRATRALIGAALENAALCSYDNLRDKQTWVLVAALLDAIVLSIIPLPPKSSTSPQYLSRPNGSSNVEFSNDLGQRNLSAMLNSYDLATTGVDAPSQNTGLNERLPSTASNSRGHVTSAGDAATVKSATSPLTMDTAAPTSSFSTRNTASSIPNSSIASVPLGLALPSGNLSLPLNAPSIPMPVAVPTPISTPIAFADTLAAQTNFPLNVHSRAYGSGWFPNSTSMLAPYNIAGGVGLATVSFYPDTDTDNTDADTDDTNDLAAASSSSSSFSGSDDATSTAELTPSASHDNRRSRLYAGRHSSVPLITSTLSELGIDHGRVRRRNNDVLSSRIHSDNEAVLSAFGTENRMWQVPSCQLPEQRTAAQNSGIGKKSLHNLIYEESFKDTGGGDVRHSMVPPFLGITSSIIPPYVLPRTHNHLHAYGYPPVSTTTSLSSPLIHTGGTSLNNSHAISGNAYASSADRAPFVEPALPPSLVPALEALNGSANETHLFELVSAWYIDRGEVGMGATLALFAVAAMVLRNAVLDTPQTPDSLPLTVLVDPVAAFERAAALAVHLHRFGLFVQAANVAKCSATLQEALAQWSSFVRDGEAATTTLVGGANAGQATQSPSARGSALCYFQTACYSCQAPLDAATSGSSVPVVKDDGKYPPSTYLSAAAPTSATSAELASVSSPSATKRAFSCNSCHRGPSLCVVCHKPVRGLFTWCQTCGHGGCLTCLTSWFGVRGDVAPDACGIPGVLNSSGNSHAREYNEGDSPKTSSLLRECKRESQYLCSYSMPSFECPTGCGCACNTAMSQ